MEILFFGKILLFGFGLIALLLLFSAIYHSYKLEIEAKKYPPPGKLVQISNTNMHVYSEGQGDTSLVFMAGHGTSSPTMDFKPLWKRLSDKYRIAVVEKAGYGWSETSSISRDIDTMLEETRKALSHSGEKGPYVLIPHSMSGLEAIYWAQKYPVEVKAIIGIDPGIPDVYEKSPGLLSQNIRLKFMFFISRIGLSRFMDKKQLEKNVPLIKSKEFSGEDKENILFLFYKSAITRNMLREIDYIRENVKKIKAKPVPANTPMYFFISDGSEVIFPEWKEQLTKYVSGINVGKYKYFSCGHYVHHEKSVIIAEEIKNFLDYIDKK